MDLDSEAIDFLRLHNVGVIGTIGEDGELWNTVIYYVADLKGAVSFFTKNETKKYTNLLKNPNIAFVVFDQNQRVTLQMSGRTEVVTDQLEVSLFYDKLDRAVDFESHPLPIEKLKNAGNYVVMKITPRRIHFSDYSKPSVDHSDA